jgi:short-subunit dehydrogenase
MDLNGSRILLAGATGALGERFARGLAERGARLALAGRDREALSRLGDELRSPVLLFDLSDPRAATETVAAARSELGGLDALVIASGAVAFGRVGEIDPAVEAELFALNATGPMGLVSAALDELSPDGAVVAITAVVAEFPTAGMAAYSASKAALAAYLAALRRERRKELSTVLEVSPGHMDTGFADRALAGEPPALPEGEDADELVETALDALAANKREVRYDLKSRELVVK